VTRKRNLKSWRIRLSRYSSWDNNIEKVIEPLRLFTDCWKQEFKQSYTYLIHQTTSVTQATSDEYDNNSGSITAARISALFRLDFDLTRPRWTHKRPYRSSKPPVDDWSERGLTTVTEDLTTTKTNYNSDLTNFDNTYRLTYSTLYWLLPTDELTKQLNSTALKLNWNWRDYNVLKTKNDKNQTTTGSGIFLPAP